MTQNLIYRTYGIFLISVLILYGFSILLDARGYASLNNMDMWGQALLAREGLTKFDDVISAYPPLPYMLTIILDNIIPYNSANIPNLIAALLAGIVIAAWFHSSVSRQIGLARSLLCIALLGLNPLFLRIVSEGPGFVLMHWGLWLTAIGLFGLRRRSRINDLILVAMGLTVIAFSHPFGIILIFSCLPFLGLVIPPNKLRDAPVTTFMILLFPVLFLAASFFYINAVFSDGPFSFLGRITAESASLSGQYSSNFITSILLSIIGVLITAPIAVLLFFRSYGMPPIRFSIAALMASLFFAILLGYLFGWLPSLALSCSFAVTIAAACFVKWPKDMASVNSPLLLFLGLIGGLLVTIADTSHETSRWKDALANNQVSAADEDVQKLAEHIKGKKDILFDAHSIPSAITLRGNASGFWSRESDDFRRASLRRRTNASILIVRNRKSKFGSDGVGRIFPSLFDDGLTGYERTFDSKEWRAYSLKEVNE